MSRNSLPIMCRWEMILYLRSPTPSVIKEWRIQAVFRYHCSSIGWPLARTQTMRNKQRSSPTAPGVCKGGAAPLKAEGSFWIRNCTRLITQLLLANQGASSSPCRSLETGMRTARSNPSTWNGQMNRDWPALKYYLSIKPISSHATEADCGLLWVMMS